MTISLKVREMLIKLRSRATRLEAFIEGSEVDLAFREIEALGEVLEELESCLKEAES